MNAPEQQAMFKEMGVIDLEQLFFSMRLSRYVRFNSRRAFLGRKTILSLKKSGPFVTNHL